MARKSPQKPPSVVTPPKYVLPIYKSVALLALVALSSTASQATLSPSHGSFPAAIYHTRIIAAIIVLAAPADYLFKLVLPRSIRGKSAFLPFISACIPMTQLALLPSARTIGAMGSAALIEFLTIGPLLALTLNVTWKSFQASNPQNEDLAGEPVVAMVISTVLYVALQVISAYALPSLIGLALPLTRSFLPILLSVVTAAVIPSKVALLAALPILHTVLLNPHTPFARPTAILNSTISIDGFSLVTREESLTGYLSVLENTQKGFRVMRCDHSLLGGEWVFGKGDWPGGVSGEFKRGVVGEPIYTVFIMLEAIRLVQDSNGMLEPELWENGTMLDGPMIPDKDASALVIGLGIGTTPGALIMHGVQTTVVEIDPAVHRLAVDYFALPKNHTAIIEDATVFVKKDLLRIEQEQKIDSNKDGRYNYIVHDVFTGGAEPIDLFTVEFIQTLSDLLQPNGVIAINYATDLYLPSAAYTFRTILSVFPNCRLFRENPAPDADTVPAPTNDFTNMVIFCRKSTTPFAFRKPTNADLLASNSRGYVLVPQHEVNATQAYMSQDGWRERIIKRGGRGVKVLQRYHARGAVGHWEVMRTVIPARVWENW